MSRRAFAHLTQPPISRFRSDDTKSNQANRRALGDITNGILSEPETLPPIEHMHLPPSPPKYKGVEFIPSEEPWFEMEIQLEDFPPILPEIQWM